MQKIKQIAKIGLGLAATLVPTFAALAAGDVNTLFGGATQKTAFEASVGLGTRDIRETIASLIGVIMGFLGILAVVIILLGGFMWMTAGGNEEKVGKAKKLIVSGIIGLVIVLAAYAIATFVVSSIYTATQ